MTELLSDGAIAPQWRMTFVNRVAEVAEDANLDSPE
jgi:hypothetical protein